MDGIHVHVLEVSACIPASPLDILASVVDVIEGAISVGFRNPGPVSFEEGERDDAVSDNRLRVGAAGSVFPQKGCVGSAESAGAHPAWVSTCGSESYWILIFSMSGSRSLVAQRYGHCQVVCVKVPICESHMRQRSVW